MRFIITRASGMGADKSAEVRHGSIFWDDVHGVWTIEVGSVEDMVYLIEHYDHPIVIGFTKDMISPSPEARKEYPYNIIVYDDYLD